MLGLLYLPVLNGQNISLDRQIWDFGDVLYWKNDTAWFKVRNATEKNIVFLPTYYQEDYRVMFSSRLVEPGQSVDVGIVYYTESKGKFNVEVPLYVNVRPDPLVFRLKGNIRGFDPAAQLRCPIVNAGAEENRLAKLVELEVRDRETDELLKPDNLSVRSRENDRIRLEAWGTGYRMAVFPGTFRIAAEKKGYDDYLATVTLEPYQNRFIIYMDRRTDTMPKKPIILPRLDSLPPLLAGRKGGRREEPRSGEPEDSVTVWLEEETKNEPHVDEHVKIAGDTFRSGEPVGEPGGLDARVYRFNNIIFILDVSMSMKRDRKLDHLKSGISLLVDALRDDDYLGIIGFSTQAVLVQSPGPVTEKDSIKARLNRMKADGGTNGGAALQMAYSLAERSYMPDGNNQIIIATDGLFSGGNLSRKQIDQLVAEGNKKGIHLSTIGFGYDARALGYLENLSALGGGSYLHITDTDAGTSALLDMIKTQSRRP